MAQKKKTAGKAPDSLLRLGQSLAALKEKDAACATFAELPRKYPKAPGTVKQAAEKDDDPPTPLGDAGAGECLATADALAGKYYFTMRPSVSLETAFPLYLTLEPSGENSKASKVDIIGGSMTDKEVTSCLVEKLKEHREALKKWVLEDSRTLGE